MVMLGVTVVVSQPFAVLSPHVDLDPSWVIALNWFPRDAPGTSLTFTYGPLGWLSYPLGLHPLIVVLAGVFSLASIVVLWAALRSEASAMGELGSCVVATVTTALVFSASGTPSWTLLAGLTVLALRDIASGKTGLTLPLSLAAASAGLLVVKFSEGLLGIALLTLLLATRVLASRRGMLCFGAAIGTFLATLLSLWCLVANRPASALPTWARQSTALVLGYSDAMGMQVSMTGFAAIFTGVAFLCFLIAFVILCAYWLPRLTGVRSAIWLVCLVGAVAVAGKQAFTRSDSVHIVEFYSFAIPVLVGGMRWLPRFRIAAAPLALMCVYAVWLSALQPAWLDRSTDLAMRSLTEAGRARSLDSSRAAMRDELGLSSTVLRHLQNRPVAVDPFEVSVAFAYRLQWAPVPVFQTYAAYTHDLDVVNARSLLRTPRLAVLRERVHLDDRNQLWDTPAYNMALLCNFSMGVSDGGWVVLTRANRQCGTPRRLGRYAARPGVSVPLPPPSKGQVLFMRFAPARVSLFMRVKDVLSVHPSHLTVTVSGQRYRVPLSLASGPMILRVPRRLAVFAVSPGQFARSVSFSEAGTVTFYDRTSPTVRGGD